MKLCPNCKAELDDNTRFCLSCMTALDKKEQIPPPVRQSHRWLVALLLLLVSGVLLVLIVIMNRPDKEKDTVGSYQETIQMDAPVQGTEEQPAIPAPSQSDYSHKVDGVQYTFRPATRDDYPGAINPQNYYVLTRVEGVPPDGIYQVPSFVGDDTTALVIAIADGAFSGTDAQCIDLGYNVRYVFSEAFVGCKLTELYLHTDVQIDQAAFSGCTEELTIHCPDYLENTEGVLWSVLAARYGFRWQLEAF